MPEFARSTTLITGLTALGLLLGFAVNLVVAATFGVGPEMDAYLAATTLPNLITTILSVSLAATFIPVYTEHRERDASEAWKLASAFMNLVALAGIALCAAGLIFSGPIVRLTTPGLPAREAAEAASMLRWLLPGVMLTGINQVISGAYYSNGRFLAPLLIRVLGPLLTLAYVSLFAEALSVRSLVLATLSANILQTLILVSGVGGRGSWRPSWEPGWNHPAVRRVLRLMIPMAVGMCFYKLTPVIERAFASGMAAGSISLVGYATRLTNALQPILVSGLSLSGFVLMSRHVSNGDSAALRSVLTRGCGMLLFASVPLALLLSGFGRPVIALLFERNAFTPQDTLATYRLFCLYILVLPASTAGTLIGQAFYALQDTRTPLLVGLLDTLLFAALLFGLAPRLELAALPVSYLCAFYATSLLICALLSRKAGFSVPRMLARPFFQSLVAAGIALAVGLSLDARLFASDAGSALCLAFSGLLYLAIQKWVFRSPEIETLSRLAWTYLPRPKT